MSIKEKLESTLKFKYQTDLTGPNIFKTQFNIIISSSILKSNSNLND